MSEESDDPDSSDSRSCQRMLTVAGMVLCAVQFAFFIYMILSFVEFNFNEGLKFMLLAYSSAFVYRHLENSGKISVPVEN